MFNKEKILAILTLAVIVAAGLWVWKFSDSRETGSAACTMEAKICPDGSFVSRIAPDCDFAPCPEEPSGGLVLSEDEAFAIAQASQECLGVGPLSEAHYFYNENSKTWWIDLDRSLEAEEDGCRPACVVSEETKIAEVNWRCTGLLPQ